MYEHDWHWKRALIACFAGPGLAIAFSNLVYWLLGHLVVIVGAVDPELTRYHYALTFLDFEMILIAQVLGTPIGIAGMFVLGIPVSIGLAKLTKKTKVAYFAASLAIWSGFVLITQVGQAPIWPSAPDLFYISYALLAVLVNGWIAHLIVHGKRKRPPVRVETVFE